MWRRIVVGTEKPVAVWQQNGVTEVYDRDALELNLDIGLLTWKQLEEIRDKYNI